ncbi:MAG: hypothetical protein Q4E06_01895 [Lautropia sp.]|nr:hypothetical protein [Lautropia sp.]
MNATPPFFWNQPLGDNLIETALLVLALLFLGYVLRLAFFDHND